MNQIRYKFDARTKTFLMLWLGFGFNLMAETEWSQIDWKEVDHIVPKAKGGKNHYKNLQLLHRHCHHQKTAEDRQRQMDNKGQKKAQKKTNKSRNSETKQGSAVKTA